MCCSLPVPRSLADTFTIPFASISKVTSICGTPLLAGGIPSRRNCPRVLLSLRELTLTLYNVDIYSGLVISCGGEDLALLGRDCGISLDQSGCNTAHGLDGQGQRSNIQKKDITCTGISCQLTTLDGSTDGYALIRVQGSCSAHVRSDAFTLSCTAGIRVEPPTRRTLERSDWHSGLHLSVRCLYRACSTPLPGHESARRILHGSGSCQSASVPQRLL